MNWQPNAEQHARINELCQWFMSVMPELWGIPLQTDSRLSFVGYYSEDRKETRATMQAALENAYSSEYLSKAIFDYYVFPLVSQPTPTSQCERLVQDTANCFIREWVKTNKEDYGFSLLVSRVKYMLTHVTEGYEKLALLGDRYSEDHGYLIPQISCCANLIKHYEKPAGCVEFPRSFLTGEWNTPCLELQAYERWRDCSSSYALYKRNLHPLIQQCRWWLFDAGEYTYELFCQATEIFGTGFFRSHYLSVSPGSGYEKESEKFRQSVLESEYHDRYAWKLLENIESNQLRFLSIMGRSSYERPGGSKWILKGLEILQQRSYTAKQLESKDDPMAQISAWLLTIDELEENVDEVNFIRQLGVFQKDVLRVALPYVGAARAMLLKALGWEDLAPFHDELFRIAGAKGDAELADFPDIPNSENPNRGVIDVEILKTAIAAAKPDHLKKYIKSLNESPLKIKNSLMMVEAFQGLNRSSIEKKLLKHGQPAIKAYGLLPVESDKELLDRYFAFKRLHKEASQYGSERQLNTRAAVQAGLTNLSRVAGFSDPTRMEWKLESKVAGESVPLGKRIEVEDWELELNLDGITPVLTIYKQNKMLKSVPAGLRKHTVYLNIKEVQQRLKDQAGRFRKTLENMMASGERISRDDFDVLCALPVTRIMLGQLILGTSAGQGLLNTSNDSLITIGGSQISIGDELVQILHPYHFYQAGTLSAWQKIIVQRKIIQPFKQVFRELYIVTPAEEDTKTYSNRFAGHVVKADVTSRLLQGRDWRQVSSDVPEVYKPFPEAKLRAEIEFPDARHYLSGSEHIIIDQIKFTREYEAVPLTSIPPLIFSEVMRDVDLIAAVAHTEENDKAWSRESYLRRAELVNALISDIGLKGVQCEGHFAYIQGKLARYRIHLGSAAIHIEPGNYLCIVPERKKEEKLFLPFADTDSKATEIISKIFLLANDSKIKDQSILGQISAASGSA